MAQSFKRVGLSLLVVVIALCLLVVAEARIQDGESLIRMKLFSRKGPHLLRLGGQKPRVLVRPPYIGQITLGTPADKYYALFDTGVSNLLIPYSECWECEFGVKKFNTTKSRTFKDDGRKVNTTTWQATQGGFIGFDDISVGGAAVKGQGIFLVNKTKQINTLRYGGFDVTFGLGFDAQAAGNVKTPVTQMFEQKLISKKMVSIYQNKQHRPLSHTGEVIFGGIDETKFSGEITFQATSPGLWKTKFDQISILDQVNGCDSDSGCSVYLNTGSPVSYGPRKDVKRINEALGAKLRHDKDTDDSIYQFPSCQTSDLPTLDFTVAGRKFSISADDYVLRMYDTTEQGAVCISGLVGHTEDKDTSYWTLGDPFVGTQYTVLDYENSRVGFATRHV